MLKLKRLALCFLATALISTTALPVNAANTKDLDKKTQVDKITGIHKIGKYYYLYYDSGRRAGTGLASYHGKRYLVKNGIILTGLRSYKGQKYYSTIHGLKTGWITINKKQYYFSEKTYRMVRSWWIEGYYLNQSGVKKVEDEPRSYIFCGDSRTRQLEEALGRSDIQYVAKSGRGYSWFVREGLPELDKLLKRNPKVNVILNFGVNDLPNINRYVSLYHKLIANYPKTRFYIESVNPIDETVYTPTSKVSTAKIQKFNSAMKREFSQQYIDMYQYLSTFGFDTLDGVHYTASTYQRIYDRIVWTIEK